MHRACMVHPYTRFLQAASRYTGYPHTRGPCGDSQSGTSCWGSAVGVHHCPAAVSTAAALTRARTVRQLGPAAPRAGDSPHGTHLHRLRLAPSSARARHLSLRHCHDVPLRFMTIRFPPVFNSGPRGLSANNLACSACHRRPSLPARTTPPSHGQTTSGPAGLPAQRMGTRMLRSALHRDPHSSRFRMKRKVPGRPPSIAVLAVWTSTARRGGPRRGRWRRRDRSGGYRFRSPPRRPGRPERWLGTRPRPDNGCTGAASKPSPLRVPGRRRSSPRSGPGRRSARTLRSGRLGPLSNPIR